MELTKDICQVKQGIVFTSVSSTARIMAQGILLMLRVLKLKKFVADVRCGNV